MLWRPSSSLSSSLLFTIVKQEYLKVHLAAIKFFLKDHWVGGKAARGFGADQFRTLVSMATDSSHRVIMGKTASSSFLAMFLIRSFSYLQVTMTFISAWMS